MATTLSLVRSFCFDGTYTTDADLEVASADLFNLWNHEYVNGTSANQANTWWADTMTVNGASQIDLTSGLTDRWGNALTFTKVTELFVRNNRATIEESAGLALSLEGTFIASIFGGTTSVYPQGFAIWSSPLQPQTVTNSVNDIVAFQTDDDEPYTIDIVIVGIR